MATHWRTEPSHRGDNSRRLHTDFSTMPGVSGPHSAVESTAERQHYMPRPQIYVHFEFGVSYSPRRPPNRRSLTFHSKNWRDHSFPRQVPPPTTNFLAGHEPPAPAPAQTSAPVSAPAPALEYPQIQAIPPTPLSPQRDWHQWQHPAVMQVPQRPRSPDYNQFGHTLHTIPSSRASRNESRSPGSSSHERGSSAPPPWNTSPWDMAPEPLGSSALPTRRADTWKTLPPLPTSYRLSEEVNDGQAWSSFSWPEEYGFPDDSQDETVAGPSRPRGRPATSHHTPINEDPEPRRQLEDLSSAMLTVDNGFEGQWWNQGERVFLSRQLETGEIFTPPRPFNPDPVWTTEPVWTTSLPSSPMDSRTSAWVVARRPLPSNFGSIVSPDDDQPYPPRSGLDALTVSPISDTTSPRRESPSSSNRLRRAMTVRSDELFMSV
jgi:hypothetical protein